MKKRLLTTLLAGLMLLSNVSYAQDYYGNEDAYNEGVSASYTSPSIVAGAVLVGAGVILIAAKHHGGHGGRGGRFRRGNDSTTGIRFGTSSSSSRYRRSSTTSLSPGDFAHFGGTSSTSSFTHN